MSMEIDNVSTSEARPIVFGQLMIGPPGSGKSTYCKTMLDTLIKLGRDVITVNLDPGNDIELPYKADINICELITVEDVMKKFNMGPNGALIQCMEYLEINYNWFLEKIKSKVKDLSNPYILIDNPGQVELYVHNDSLKNVINRLCSKGCPMDFRFCVVNLVDSYYTNDPSKFIASLSTSLASMLHFELPHVNVLSKLDLIEKYNKTDFNLDYYCEVMDLEHLVQTIPDDPFFVKHKKLTASIASLVEQYSLVSYVPLNVNDGRTVLTLLNYVDKANGFFLIRIKTEQHKLRFYDDYSELCPPPSSDKFNAFDK